MIYNKEISNELSPIFNCCTPCLLFYYTFVKLKVKNLIRYCLTGCFSWWIQKVKYWDQAFLFCLERLAKQRLIQIKPPIYPATLQYCFGIVLVSKTLLHDAVVKYYIPVLCFKLHAMKTKAFHKVKFFVASKLYQRNFRLWLVNHGYLD